MSDLDYHEKERVKDTAEIVSDLINDESEQLMVLFMSKVMVQGVLPSDVLDVFNRMNEGQKGVVSQFLMWAPHHLRNMLEHFQSYCESEDKHRFIE